MSILQTSQSTQEQLRGLPLRLLEHADLAEAVVSLAAGEAISFEGVWGASRALLAAALQQRASSTLLVVLPDEEAADNFCDEAPLFLDRPIERFPAWESEPGERLVYDEIYGDRLRLLKRLAAGERPAIVAAGIQALLQPTVSQKTVEQNTRLLRVGEQIDVDALLKWLTARGFHATTAVELPGEFSLRGGILDLFAPDWQRPVRIELFDDEVESIRRFEISTQRSCENLEQVEVTVMTPRSKDREHLAAFLPDDVWVLLIEGERIDELGRLYLGRVGDPKLFHSVASVLQSVAGRPTAFASSLALSAFGKPCRLGADSVERFHGEFEEIRAQLEAYGESDDIYLISQTDGEIERLKEMLASTRQAGAGRLHYAVGHLHQGFRLRDEHVLVLSASELFHRGELRRTPKRRLGKAIDSFLDLREGDLVVHLAHGVGRFRGLELLTKDAGVEEHLRIEFRGGAKIYVPASKIDLVQKYIGGAKSKPILATIGGKSWLKQKKAAEDAVVDLAADMLELQAARASQPGIAFKPDSPWQLEFDASFPYEPTPDQLSAIRAIKGDMHTPRPMDRLLCGDVGYGKTEVSMRAAFKAVESGYQVAVMAPTTILVEQHYHTFQQRMSEFPLDIGRLSRFASTAEQRSVMAGLKSGKIDIVVGTHRLASRDVKFCNLGLVIIDEEQRFGVEVKERLKALRNSVDVLTMSATPIPRTLHMSLVGVRDISNLETPPLDRTPVETRVTRFDEELIRHAVLRELNRGGQIYFVHNRVNDIEQLAQKLQRIVPEASMRIGHGQMHETELEEVMVDFVEGKFDMLLATTIVESGLDIPNANTIFVDESDRYGLADLHQLRGRVGRYKHHAYAYMLVDQHKHLSPNAARRLRAIEEFSEMGAGFAIAMRDLEIRGAGNLLGSQQSGHIAAVGYELYCQLLENAVRALKKAPAAPSIDVDFDLPGEAFLPGDYVNDQRARIDIYRRLTRINDFDAIGEFREELSDRFGPLPEPVERMLELSEMRLHAAVWQINKVYVEDDFLVFAYASRPRVEQLSRKLGGKLRIVDQSLAYLKLKPGFSRDTYTVLKAAKSVLQIF
ncbi:transcription-repair coupling factor [Lignipirellula cremea]|uniref:Transcription-repair-coupling factor n=1 Tax=Lignipirellula cremea TaxID=2528010 RepID=A0A518E2D2_9BACT|nr:transcription-repair coupling factor [Lignipirellula cremea]QDU98257.1 Transcription-repair-coupling factor [Lignipirellula cremea]